MYYNQTVKDPFRVVQFSCSDVVQVAITWSLMSCSCCWSFWTSAGEVSWRPLFIRPTPDTPAAGGAGEVKMQPIFSVYSLSVHAVIMLAAWARSETLDAFGALRPAPPKADAPPEAVPPAATFGGWAMHVLTTIVNNTYWLHKSFDWIVKYKVFNINSYCICFKSSTDASVRNKEKMLRTEAERTYAGLHSKR